MKYIERDPERVSGSWVFKGTRIPVKMIHSYLTQLRIYSVRKVKKLWPGLTTIKIKGGINEFRKIYYPSDLDCVYYKHPNPFLVEGEYEKRKIIKFKSKGVPVIDKVKGE